MNTAALRRLLHAGSALVLLLTLFDSEVVLRLVLVGVAVVAVLADTLRIKVAAVRDWLVRVVPVFRSTESETLCGATWLAVGYALASWAPVPAGAAGILVGALADPAASWAGSLAKSEPGRKTWTGSAAAAIVAAAAIALLGIPLVAVVLGALTAATLERWPGPFDDNLVVAPGTALVVWLVL